MTFIIALLMVVGTIFLAWLLDTIIYSLPYKYTLKAIPIVCLILVAIIAFPFVNTAIHSVAAIVNMPFTMLQQTRNMYFDAANNQYLMLDDNMQLVENPDGTKTIQVKIGF